MENLINLTLTLTAILLIACVIGKIAEYFVTKKKEADDKAFRKEVIEASEIYVISSKNKQAFMDYFSFVKEGSLYEEQCYGFRVSFSEWGDDTHSPAQFIESWLTDPSF